MNRQSDRNVTQVLYALYPSSRIWGFMMAVLFKHRNEVTVYVWTALVLEDQKLWNYRHL